MFRWIAAIALGFMACSPGGATHEGATTAPTKSSAPPGPRPAETPSRARPRVVLEPPGRPPVAVRVEVADDDAERQRGLMFRTRMDRDAGMLFLFPEDEQLTFWMHNTYLPLDMIFIRSDLRVLGVVENATPQTDDPRQVEGLSRYVLEVNAGFAREHGIGPGTQVRFEEIPNAPAARGPR